MRQCSKCEQTKPVRGFHNRTCGPCRRDLWRQNKGLPPVDPANAGVHLIGYPLKQHRRPVAEILEAKHLKKLNQRSRVALPRAEIKALTQRLLVEQGGVCAICKELKPRMCLDHDHKTGEVRGVLCDPCNTALGLFKDSPALLESARLYTAAPARAKDQE